MEMATKYGQFSWNELVAKDKEAAKEFYSKLFGWETEEMGQNYTVFKLGGEQVAGLMPMPEQAEQMGAMPYWGSYVTVDDVDGVVRHAQEMGATILVPPQEAPGVGRFALIQDPQGAMVSIIKYEEGYGS